MNKILITGLNGRLAPFLKLQLQSRGITTVPFNREELDINDHHAQRTFIFENNIDAICHLANGPESWVSTLASIARELNIHFLFTSTESVFNPESSGPFMPTHTPDAMNDYGRYKIACEKAALAANSNTIIARLGWQMFATFDQDNLLTHVSDMHNEKGYLEASTRWFPAVSYVEDTMHCLYELLADNKSGIYHVGGNDDGLSFYDLVILVKYKYGLDWDVRPCNVPDRDGRIMDERVHCPGIQLALQSE